MTGAVLYCITRGIQSPHTLTRRDAQCHQMYGRMLLTTIIQRRSSNRCLVPKATALCLEYSTNYLLYRVEIGG